MAESLRRRISKLAAAASALKGHSGAVAPFSLAFMSDGARVLQPELVARALPSGAALILRDYRAPRREALARRLLSLCRARGVLFLVGADARLALEIGADGVHWPSWRTRDRRALAGLITTAACHSAQDLAAAAADQVDLALLSPVFRTRSHLDATPLGEERFRSLAAAGQLPVLALGGVDEANARRLAAPNVAGFAAIGAFLPR